MGIFDGAAFGTSEPHVQGSTVVTLAGISTRPSSKDSIQLHVIRLLVIPNVQWGMIDRLTMLISSARLLERWEDGIFFSRDINALEQDYAHDFNLHVPLTVTLREFSNQHFDVILLRLFLLPRFLCSYASSPNHWIQHSFRNEERGRYKKTRRERKQSTRGLWGWVLEITALTQKAKVRGVFNLEPFETLTISQPSKMSIIPIKSQSDYVFSSVSTNVGTMKKRSCSLSLLSFLLSLLPPLPPEWNKHRGIHLILKRLSLTGLERHWSGYMETF